MNHFVPRNIAAYYANMSLEDLAMKYAMLGPRVTLTNGEIHCDAEEHLKARHLRAIIADRCQTGDVVNKYLNDAFDTLKMMDFHDSTDKMIITQNVGIVVKGIKANAIIIDDVA